MNKHIPIIIPEKFKCPICYELLEKPMQSNPCGHNVCLACVANLQIKKCPLCQTECSFFPDARLQRELHNEILNCHECGEKVAFKNYHEHLSEICMKTHVKCKLCGEMVVYRDFVKHAEICPKHCVGCKCGSFLTRDELPLHEKYYCTFSQTCINIDCQICGQNIPVTLFQSHYEREHLKRDKKRQIFPRIALKFDI